MSACVLDSSTAKQKYLNKSILTFYIGNIHDAIGLKRQSISHHQMPHTLAQKSYSIPN